MVENDIMQAKKIVGVYYDKGKQADSEMPILPERSEPQTPKLTESSTSYISLIEMHQPQGG